jgi:arginine/lysine/histidine transporter system substrate-binding protein
MKKFFSVFMLVALVMSVLVACGTSNSSTSGSEEQAETEEKKVLVMGTSADFPPFEYIDTAKSEEIIGFDVDIIHALADKLGYEVEIKDMDFSGLIAALQAGKVDFVMSGMAPTEERKQNVDFTDSYYRSDLVLLFEEDSKITSADDLSGKVLGAQVNSFQEEVAKELNGTVDFTLETRDRTPDLIQELKSKRFDAVIMEEAVAIGYMSTNDNLKTISVPNGETPGTAIAFPKGSELTEEFNTALKEMIDSGEIDELVVKWFVE